MGTPWWRAFMPTDLAVALHHGETHLALGRHLARLAASAALLHLAPLLSPRGRAGEEAEEEDRTQSHRVRMGCAALALCVLRRVGGGWRATRCPNRSGFFGDPARGWRQKKRGREWCVAAFDRRGEAACPRVRARWLCAWGARGTQAAVANNTRSTNSLSPDDAAFSAVDLRFITAKVQVFLWSSEPALERFSFRALICTSGALLKASLDARRLGQARWQHHTAKPSNF